MNQTKLYKLIKDQSDGTEINVRKNVGSGVYLTIPFDSDNVDYQEYLKWKSDGGVPEEADADFTDWDLVREKRDRLLRESDWTMTTGATVDQAQWAAYRDKLRAIPQTFKNVSDPLTEVTWPTAPSTKGPNTD